MLQSKADVVYGNTPNWINSVGKKIGERRQTPLRSLRLLAWRIRSPQPAIFWSKAIYEKALRNGSPSYWFAFDTEMFVRFCQVGRQIQVLEVSVGQFPDSTPIEIVHSTRSSCRRASAAPRSLHLPHPFDSFYAQCARNYTRFRRTLWYLLQGDLWWLAQRIPDRLRARQSVEIVGPRSKWM